MHRIYWNHWRCNDKGCKSLHYWYSYLESPWILLLKPEYHFLNEGSTLHSPTLVGLWSFWPSCRSNFNKGRWNLTFQHILEFISDCRSNVVLFFLEKHLLLPKYWPKTFLNTWYLKHPNIIRTSFRYFKTFQLILSQNKKHCTIQYPLWRYK